MTKSQFRKRWKSNAEGGGITFDDIADCAIEWGICSKPKIRRMEEITQMVLKAAACLSREEVWDAVVPIDHPDHPDNCPLDPSDRTNAFRND